MSKRHEQVFQRKHKLSNTHEKILDLISNYRNAKIKPQQEATLHPPSWLKFKNLRMPSVDEVVLMLCRAVGYNPV